MNIFGTRKLVWWQVSLLKISVACFGIAIGASWPEVFAGHIVTLVAVALILGVYLAIVWFSQK